MLFGTTDHALRGAAVGIRSRLLYIFEMRLWSRLSSISTRDTRIHLCMFLTMFTCKTVKQYGGLDR
ncbi:hypothetical protein VPH35_052680 [Triticum aestivum]